MRKEIYKECSCCHKKKPGVKLLKMEDCITGEVYEDLFCQHCYEELCLEI